MNPSFLTEPDSVSDLEWYYDHDPSLWDCEEACYTDPEIDPVFRDSYGQDEEQFEASNYLDNLVSFHDEYKAVKAMTRHVQINIPKGKQNDWCNKKLLQDITCYFLL